MLCILYMLRIMMKTFVKIVIARPRPINKKLTNSQPENCVLVPPYLYIHTYRQTAGKLNPLTTNQFFNTKRQFRKLGCFRLALGLVKSVGPLASSLVTSLYISQQRS